MRREEDHGSVRARGVRRRSIAAAPLVLILVLLPSAGAMAVDAGGRAGSVLEYSLGDPVDRRVQLAYGAARGDSIPIGTGTTRIVMDVEESTLDGGFPGGVACSIYGSHSPSVDQSDITQPLGGRAGRVWTTEQWADPAQRYLELAEGTIAVWPGQDPRSYDRFDLFCDSQADVAGRQLTRLLWRLTPVVSDAGVTTVTQDPALLFDASSREQYSDGGAVRVATLGDEVRLSATAGTWSAEYGVRVLVGSAFVPSATVEPDGSAVRFPVPARANGFGVTVVEVSGGVRVPRGPIDETVQRTWTATVDVRATAVRSSSTTLDLGTRYALGAQRLIATVQVTRPGAALPPLDGVVVIRVDGKAVGDGPLRGDGSARIRLPRLPAGVHRVTAEYKGDAATSASESAGAWLRVLTLPRG